MSLTYKNQIKVEEVNAIRKLMGWRQLHPEQLQASLDGSTLVVAAYEENQAIGMTRLIWDGGSVALIPNILVIPEYQIQGIEIEMITRILDFLHTKLKPGFGIQVDIKVFNNQEIYYQKLGFQVSTIKQRGQPMHVCLSNQIELMDAMYKQCEFK